MPLGGGGAKHTLVRGRTLLALTALQIAMLNKDGCVPEKPRPPGERLLSLKAQRAVSPVAFSFIFIFKVASTWAGMPLACGCPYYIIL